jgi:peptidoglycan-associated lipoprotein
MLQRISFKAVFVFIIAMFMTAGCAQQAVVKKDEGIAPAPVVKQVEATKSNETAPTGLVTTTPTSQVTVQPATSALQAPKFSTNEQLQSGRNKIYFPLDSNGLSESARDTLTKNTALLMKESSAKIRIEGNCDERDSAEYNLALGERRAKAAQQYYITLGVKPDRLATISYGKEKPAVQGSDEDAWAKNRRDEFVVVAK